VGGTLYSFCCFSLYLFAYHLYVINHIGMAAIAALASIFLIGYTGQISLGHGAFVGVGAYAAAILATQVHFPSGSLLYLQGNHCLCGRGIGIPSVRLKHLYLTIATLAGQFILQYLFRFMGKPHQGTRGHYVASCLPLDSM